MILSYQITLLALAFGMLKLEHRQVLPVLVGPTTHQPISAERISLNRTFLRLPLLRTRLAKRSKFHTVKKENNVHY